MAKRLTPIERAIAGEPTDRRRRYDQRKRDQGFVRVTFTCTRAQAAVLKRAMQALASVPEVSPDDPDEQFGEALQAVDDALLQMTIAEILLPPERPDAPAAKRGRTGRTAGTGASVDAL
jgi:hypothetical protein